MKSVEELIETKTWSELSSDERALLADLASNEEEFYQAKSFFEQLEPLVSASQKEVSPAIKSSLNQVFQVKHPGITQTWEASNAEAIEKKIIPLYQRGWFRIAAILLIGSSFSIFFWKTSVQETKAKTEIAFENKETKQTSSNASFNSSEKNKDSRKIDAESTINKFTPPILSEESNAPMAVSATAINTESVSSFKETVAPAPETLRGMDKDLNPYANDELTVEQRERPRPTASYFTIIEPSF